MSVLWGIPPWGGPCIKVASGTLAEMLREYRTRESQGWDDLAIRPSKV